MTETVSQGVVDVRRRTITRIQAARSATEELRARVGQIFSDISAYEHLSPQGRQQEAQRASADAWNETRGPLHDARDDVERALRRSEEKIEELTTVSDEEIAHRAVLLRPLADATLDGRPELLLNALRTRFGELPWRRALEEQLELLIDGLAGSDGGALAQGYQDLRTELDARRSPEERQAVADRDGLAELERILGLAEGLVSTVVDALSRGEVSGGDPVLSEMRRAELDMYISMHTSSSGDQGPVRDMWGNLYTPGG